MSTIAVGNGMHHASTVAEENPCRAKEENEAYEKENSQPSEA